eukprot:CAMPEP_0171908862 /NCGR_PEP_ID=MMETSP0993-20121228/8257_1 /TAXON_ID=483369 /ORGANISM="non described non described, Strain CCMP2098" /LENGTH=473 /DNA_ID=CAMNT_0012541625 /DNA_START=62 /DNA_END=1480 /DNA_ORIENTATION=-
MQQSYSFNISETLIQEGGVSDEDLMVQTVRAEIYDRTPLIAVHGGSFGSLQETAIRNVSNANLQTMLRISRNNLMDLAGGGGGEGEKSSLALDPAAELAKLVKQRSSDVVTGPLAVAVGLSLVTQFLCGYNTAVLNSVSQVVFPGHSTTAWAVAVGAFAIGGPVGSMVAGRLADRLGRRAAMLLCTYTFLFGGLVLSVAPTMAVLTGARVVLGFASGFSSVLVPIYLGELAPPSFRGLFGTCTQMALVCGILAAAVLAFPLGNYNLEGTVQGWRWMMSVTPLCCCVQLLLAPLLHESPRWLLQQNPHSAQAALSLKQLYGLKTDKEVDLEISHILNAADKAGPSSTPSISPTSKNSLTMSKAAANNRQSGSGRLNGNGSGGNGSGYHPVQANDPHAVVLQASGALSLNSSAASMQTPSALQQDNEGTMPLKGGYAGTGAASAPPSSTSSSRTRSSKGSVMTTVISGDEGAGCG